RVSRQSGGRTFQGADGPTSASVRGPNFAAAEEISFAPTSGIASRGLPSMSSVTYENVPMPALTAGLPGPIANTSPVFTDLGSTVLTPVPTWELPGLAMLPTN